MEFIRCWTCIKMYFQKNFVGRACRNGLLILTKALHFLFHSDQLTTFHTTATSLSTDVDHQKEPAQAEARLITAKLELNTAKLELNTAKLLLNTEKSELKDAETRLVLLMAIPNLLKDVEEELRKQCPLLTIKPSRPREFCSSRDGWAR